MKSRYQYPIFAIFGDLPAKHSREYVAWSIWAAVTKYTTWALLAAVALLAIAAVAGYPLIPHESLAGLGMMPLAVGETTYADIKQMIEKQGDTWSAYVKKTEGEIAALNEAVVDIAKKARRPNMGGFGGGAAMDSGERKTLDSAIRALMAGDKAKADALFVEAKAMSAGSNPDGGYMVHTQFSGGFTKVMQEISPVFRMARVIDLDAGNDSFEEPIDRETATASWVGEQGSRPETGTPQLGLFYVPLHEIYAMPKTTQTLIDTSSLDVMNWLQTKVGEAFGTKESDAIHNGDGVAKPRGFLTYDIATTADATRAWGTIQYVASGASGAFAASNPQDQLVDMVTALKPQYRQGAVWLMNRNTAGVLRKMKDGEGRFLWSDSLVLGQPSTLLGYPVEIDEDMPNMAANSLSVAFGNFTRAYTVVQKPGIKFLPDPFSAKPHVLLYSYRRVGGAMNNSEAVKLMKFATT
jgi:HK97 family phage major capsid protein